MNITVYNAALIPDGDSTSWVVTVRVDDEEFLQGHYIPIETFENTAAEYDMDPSDFDAIMEMVLYRAYIPDEDAAVDHPKQLFRAESVDEAREHILECIQKVKGSGRLKGVSGVSAEQALDDRGTLVLARSGKEDPLKTIKRISPMSPEVVEAKRRVVHTRRETHASRAQARTAAVKKAYYKSDEERLAEAQEEFAQGRAAAMEEERRRAGRPIMNRDTGQIVDRESGDVIWESNDERR